jgi:hypothetical protein
MSQHDQDRDRKNEDEGYQDRQDETWREGRGDSPAPDSDQVNRGSQSEDRDSDLSEADDMDEDRDDDLRTDGSSNRRHNIG